MNDFLQSLRNGQAEKGRGSKTRKSYDNSYHYSSGPRYHSYSGGYQNTRSQQMKRPPISQSPGNHAQTEEALSNSMLAEAIETLSVHIETLAKNQEYLINAQERTADMMERQAVAIEKIVNHLNIAPVQEDAVPHHVEPEKTFEHHYVTPAKENDAPAEDFEEPKPVIRRRKKITDRKPARKTEDQKLLGREEIMDIIHTMRDQGATYDQVASRLVELGQPTFSGRGEWHAQTIHRLCNKK